jgi:hypothetical protein
MLSGLTLKVALGAVRAGAAGGAGGTCFFLHPPTTTIAVKAMTIRNHFILLCFNSSSTARKLAFGRHKGLAELVIFE